MAVRDDFAAGEVLAAADLNDTFASKLPYSFGTATPSTTDSGFLWYDSNSTPPVPKYWNGSSFATLAPTPGLSLLANESVTAQSAVSISGVFSSTYENYRVLFYLDKSTNAGNLIRLRDGSGDVTATNYFHTTWYHNNGGASARISNATAANAWTLGDNPRNVGYIDLFSPNRAVRTGYWAGISDIAADSSSPHISGGGFSDTTQFTGISIIMSTGTFTGTVKVYGYKD